MITRQCIAYRYKMHADDSTGDQPQATGRRLGRIELDAGLVQNEALNLREVGAQGVNRTSARRSLFVAHEPRNPENIATARAA